MTDEKNLMLDEDIEIEEDNGLLNGVLVASTVLMVGAAGLFGYSYVNLQNQKQALEEISETVAMRQAQDVVYRTSIQLMDEGYIDNRPAYEIEDAEYTAWREDNLPVYGMATGADVPISVTALDSGVTQTDIDYVTSCVATLPENFLNKCAADGWKIELISGIDMGSEYVTDEIDSVATVGQTNHETRIMTLSTGQLDCIFHEFGHILTTYAYDELTEAGFYELKRDNELADLYNHNAHNSIYIYMNAEEQLAQSFDDYLWYPRELKAQAPILYEIYDSTIAEL